MEYERALFLIDAEVSPGRRGRVVSEADTPEALGMRAGQTLFLWATPAQGAAAAPSAAATIGAARR
eukprot:3262078-Prymnesium_polylepis.1